MVLFRDFLNEAMQDIYYGNSKFSWNPNKTEKDFKKRIKERTELSNEEFYDVIQKGLNSVKLPIDNSICLYFMISKFVLIVNIKDMIITTIRDGKWDKPTNSCKNTRILNEDTRRMSQDELDYINSQKYFSIDVELPNFDLILESKCNYCFKINL